jgi:methyl-accepting chemotaxis protein
MVLGTKIVLVAVGSVFVTAAAGLLIQRSVIRRQGIELIRDTMRATILNAEDTRQSFSAMRRAGMFDDAKLKKQAAGVSDYKQTNLYKTVPVVAAWDSISDVGNKEGYSGSRRAIRGIRRTPRGRMRSAFSVGWKTPSFRNILR